MTAPPPSRGATPRWYLRPKVALPAIGVLIVIMAVNVRQRNVGRTGDQRLTTYSTSPMGARMFYEMAQRFGWRVEQSKASGFPSDTGTIIAILDPVVPLRSAEVHALLDRVRAGGALLAVLGDGSTLLADSLRLRVGQQGRSRIAHDSAYARECPAKKGGIFNGGFMYTIWPGDQVALFTLESRGPPRDSVTRFVEMDTLPADHGRARHAAVGFPFGRGRVIAGSDPDLLRNDAVRNCSYGLDIAAMQMLGYLGERGRRGRIVFDEYHQGFGAQNGTMSAVAAYMVGVPSGRTLLQLLAAGLVLLLAAAPRLIPPRDPESVERRSPLEHVDALGRAYAQVGATRSATARLVRGVRRRVSGRAVPGSFAAGGPAAAADASDDAFLDRAARDAPRIAGDVALIKKALHAGVDRREFAAVGAALEQLELSLTRI